MDLGNEDDSSTIVMMTLERKAVAGTQRTLLALHPSYFTILEQNATFSDLDLYLSNSYAPSLLNNNNNNEYRVMPVWFIKGFHTSTFLYIIIIKHKNNNI